MNRRNFILGTAAIAASSALPFNTEAARKEASIKNYNKYTQRRFTDLNVGNTGRRFEQPADHFLLAYFGTAHEEYPGCEQELLSMVYTAIEAKEDYGVNVLPVLAYPPINPAKGSRLLDKYVNRDNFGVRVAGLTGSAKLIKDIAKDHALFYRGDKHPRVGVVIAPDGQYVSKIPQNHFEYKTMAKHIGDMAPIYRDRRPANSNAIRIR